MNERRLSELLERAGDDGRGGAESRARLVVHEAFAQRPSAPRRRATHPAAVMLATVAAALAVALAATSPGAAIAQWLRDQVAGKPGLPHSAPALTHLPAGGRVLLAGHEGLWVVGADGGRRLLPGYRGATWSPRGLYIAGWRGHELSALEPGGRVHWSLARPGRISAADWSPDGYRIAYLAGAQLRAVAGDGTGDSLIRRSVDTTVAPAWRPASPHLVAFASGRHAVDLVAADARALLWRHRFAQRVHALSWSADGALLAVAERTRIAVLDARNGSVRRVVALGRGTRIQSLAFAHRGTKLAASLRTTRGRARAVMMLAGSATPAVHELFAGAGSFEQPQWSPDDRWVLIAWPAADQWLFLRAARVSSIRAVGAIASQFSSSTALATFPRLVGWCCAPGGG